jgi:hypothetical protein
MAGCSKCGEKFCACNVEDTLSVSHTGDGSTASPWLFNVRVDSDATNLLSLGANGLLTKFYGADGAGTTVAGAGTLTDPFIVDIDTSEIDLCQIVGNASVTVGCPPCDGQVLYCSGGEMFKVDIGKLRGSYLL